MSEPFDRQKPEPPQEHECCGNGCENCVWIRYREAELLYQQALAEWQIQNERV